MSSIIRKLEDAVHPHREHKGSAATAESADVNPYTGKPDYATAPIPPHRPHAPMPPGVDTATGPAPNSTGPHRYDVLNQLDPSVDSKREAPAMEEPTSAGGLTGATPHSSKNEPRRQTVPLAEPGPGPAPNSAGPHRNDLFNLLDPSVDSETGAPTGTRRHDMGHPSERAMETTAGAAPHRGGPRIHEALPDAGVLPGPAPNTAGPHRYDVLNRLDPSVDSGTNTSARPVAAETTATSHKTIGHSDTTHPLGGPRGVDSMATHKQHHSVLSKEPPVQSRYQ